MRYSALKIVFQEIPDEISLSFLITGCQLKCKGCHSADSWNSEVGVKLSENHLLELIEKYHSTITCVLFLGGEWYEKELIHYLNIIHKYNLKSALYTGLEIHEISSPILVHLDYIKTGRYIDKLGPLFNKKSNQKLIKLKNQKQI